MWATCIAGFSLIACGELIPSFRLTLIGCAMIFLLIIEGIIESVRRYYLTHSKIGDEVESYVEITRLDYGQHPLTHYKYEVGGTFYPALCSGNLGIVGEKFAMIYDRTTPKRHKVFWHRPLFTEGEETFVVTGEVRGISFRTVRYRTSVAERKIAVKRQRLPRNYREIYPLIRKGDKFEVECLLSNPKRNIIRLDKPVV